MGSGQRGNNAAGHGFPYEQFRPGQREAAEEIARGVREGLVAALRAPTGFGKTSTIIYALNLAGAERVLYLVRTINEIDPVVRELLRFREDYTFLYSARRMCPLFKSSDGEPMSVEDFWEACRLARLRGACPYYARLNEYSEEELTSLVKNVLAENMPQRSVRLLRDRLGVCPFFALRKMAVKSKFVVATYPYGFREDIFSTALDPLSYADFVIVVDEAHTLINIHHLLEQKIRLSHISDAVEEVRKYSPGAGMIVEFLERLRATLENNTPPRLNSPIRLDKSVLSWAVGELEVLHDVVEEIREKKTEEALLSTGNLASAKTVLGRIEAWLAVLSMEQSFLFAQPIDNRESVGEDRVEYVVSPMDPAVMARKPLEESKASVLSSGTLPAGDFVRELLWVKEKNTLYIDTEMLAGRFLPRKNIYAAIARDVTTRYRERSASMYRRIASYITIIARHMPGVKLAVYPSYELMRAIAGKLPSDVPAIMEEKDTSLTSVREKLMLTDDILINAVAGGKLVEGVEFASPDGKNLLHTVIIVGVPFPQPDAYTITYLDVLSNRIGYSRARFYVYTFQAIVKVLQALGRATRSPDDRAAYFLLDNRFLRKDLRGMLRLPIKKVFQGSQSLYSAVMEARKLVLGS